MKARHELQAKLRKLGKVKVSHAVVIFHDKPELSSDELEDLRKKLSINEHSQIYFRYYS